MGNKKPAQTATNLPKPLYRNDLITALRLQAGDTYRSLAEKIKNANPETRTIDQATICRVEQSGNNANVRTLADIASAYNVPITVFFDFEITEITSKGIAAHQKRMIKQRKDLSNE